HNVFLYSCLTPLPTIPIYTLSLHDALPIFEETTPNIRLLKPVPGSGLVAGGVYLEQTGKRLSPRRHGGTGCGFNGLHRQVNPGPRGYPTSGADANEHTSSTAAGLARL